MNMDVAVLCWTGATIGFLHTVLGPDHYLPFIVMNRARKWSATKTAWITFLCGLGHVGSSVVLGLIGIACGIAVMKLEAFEAFRGNLSAWALIGFGFAYMGWGIQRGIRPPACASPPERSGRAGSFAYARRRTFPHP